MKIYLKKFLILFTFLILNASAFGHPHVFIENAFTFVFDDTGLAGIRIKWILDEMFSASIIMDYDWNNNKIFEEKEIKAVERGAFINLKNFNYFMHITANNSDLKISYVTGFKAEIFGDRVVYYFFIPLNIKVESIKKILGAGCYDNTYFCDIAYSKADPVKLENASLYECSWDIVDDKKNAYWAGFIIPKIILLQFRKKNE